jgi:hypothetical protein
MLRYTRAVLYLLHAKHNLCSNPWSYEFHWYHCMQLNWIAIYRRRTQNLKFSLETTKFNNNTKVTKYAKWKKRSKTLLLKFTCSSKRTPSKIYSVPSSLLKISTHVKCNTFIYKVCSLHHVILLLSQSFRSVSLDLHHCQ